jgi:hypothetical protein
MADQFGLAVAVAALLLAAGGSAAGWGLVRLANRRADRRAVAPFVGWRRLAMVVVAGAALPVVGYLTLSRLPAIGGRGYGLGLTWPRLVIEYLAVAAAVVGLVGALSDRAARRRARELGAGQAAAAPTGRLGPAAAGRVGLVLAAATVGCLVGWNFGLGRQAQTPPMAWLLPAAGLAGLALIAGRLRRRPKAPRSRGPGDAHTPDGPAPAPTATPARTARTRRPGRWIAVGFLAAALVSMAWALSDARRYAETVPVLVVAGVASVLALASFGVVRGVAAAARAIRSRPVGGRTASRPPGPALTWAGSAALAYAAAAVVAGGIGWAALRWQERAAVGRMEGPGYGLLDEMTGTRHQAVRDYWLRQLRPSAGAAPPATPADRIGT